MGMYDRDWYRSPRQFAGRRVFRGRASGQPPVDSGRDQASGSRASDLAILAAKMIAGAVLIAFVRACWNSRGHG
jgi:hypothetical protein